MKVVHINVRLTEGGAAQVALGLHCRLIARGMASIFAYGYGSGGRPNPSNIPGSIWLTSAPRAAANLLAFKALNRDAVDPSIARLSAIRETIKDADVLHLHVIHSYFISLQGIEALMAYLPQKAKVVWTLHDHWLLTGRCAFTDGCRRWMTGCGDCPTTTNYPPTWVDRSEIGFKAKRRWVRRILDSRRVILVAPSSHLASDMDVGFGIQPHVIENGLTEEFEAAVREHDNKIAPHSLKKLLIIANDLSYVGKTDREWIYRIAQQAGIKIVCVGKNSPFSGPAYENVGEIRSRARMVATLRECAAMVFTSEVDNCPMVIMESLAAGTPVVAKKSFAAVEMLSRVGGRCPENLGEAIELIATSSEMRLYPKFRGAKQLADYSLREFGGESQFKRYLSLYGDA